MSKEKLNKNGRTETELSQVRDLLFGAQARDFEARFDTLESEVNAGLEELKASLVKRISDMEQSIRTEIGIIKERQQHDESSLNQAIQGVSQQLSSEWNQKAHDLSQQLEQSEKELRKYTLSQTQNLWDDMKAQYESLNQRVDDEFGKIRDTKAERTALGEMFREMAVRLSEEASVENS